MTPKRISIDEDSRQRDKLTGLYNRESFFALVGELVTTHAPGYYVMTCFDVNKFKVINDQYGTKKGDEVLCHIADVFNIGFAANGGICCRVSADDFAVLYPASFQSSEQIVDIRRQAAIIEGLTMPIAFSIGRYVVDDLSLTPSAMYDRAVLAAAAIKGRYDTYIGLYEESMRDRMIHEQQIVTEMEAALHAHQFEVWYQPQYNHSTGALVGAEALARWRHPNKGLIPPNDFIPIFERNGFIYALDKYIWEEACRFLRREMDHGASPLPISVNISRYDVFRPDVVDVITALVHRYDIPIELLRLEITESAFAESSQQIITVVKQLINHGFTLEIDDFGSGYSSLNTLKSVPAQVVKLDMRFFEDNNDVQRSGIIIESVVRMTKWLGMSVIAEGVEQAEQADYLRSIGCDYIQGYLYAKPMPEANYAALCQNTSKEEKLLTMETVENLDNNSFWDPKSMDTLIFNSYVGGACIYEYHKGVIELLRATQKYAQVIGSAGMTVEDALKLNWAEHLDAANSNRIIANLEESIADKKEVTGEYVFLDLPGCPHETYLRSTMRVIATAGERYLVYCTNENITAEKMAEQELRNTTTQLNTIMDDMPGGFVRMIVQPDGSLVSDFFNDGFLQLTGMTRDEVKQTYAENVLAGVHPDDLSVIKEAMEQMFDKGVAHSSRYRLRHGNGGYVWLRNFGRISTDTAGNTFLNIYYTDATEQVRAEEQQKELLDNLPCGAALYEYDGHHLSVIHLNKRYWELVDREPVQYEQTSFLKAVHTDDRETITRELASAIRDNRDAVCDLRVLYSHNSYRPFHVVGHIIARDDGKYSIYASYTPLSDAALSYQQLLPVVLSTMMSATSDLSFAKDKNFRYICASHTFALMAGQSSERDVIGKTDYDLFEKSIADKYRSDDEALLAEGKPIIDMVESIPSADDTLHFSSTSKYLLHDAGGAVIGLYGVGRDITQSLNADSQLRFVNDNIPGGLAQYIFAPDSVRIAYCNDGFYRLFGGTPEDFSPQDYYEPMKWVFEEDLPVLQAQIEALMHYGKSSDCVFRIHVIGGGYKWINYRATAATRQGESLRVNAVLLDVTERQNALEQLRMSEEENSLAVQLSDSIICRYSIAEQTLTISPDVAAKFNLPPQAINVPDEPIRLGMIAPESIDAYRNFFADIQQGCKSGTVLFQQNYLEKWRWMEAKSATVFSDSGLPVKAVITFMDVTERLEQEIVYKKWQQSLANKDAASYTLYRCNLNNNDPFEAREGDLLNDELDYDGLSFDDCTQKYCKQCVFDDDKSKYSAFLNTNTLMSNYYRGKRSATLEYREIQPDKTTRWLRLSVELVQHHNSVDVEAYLMYENITDAKKKELQTKEMAENDPLTGIYNRSAFVNRITQEINSSRSEARHALMMIDLDGFKQVNDVFGHSAGDQALVDLTATLRRALRRGDLVGRLGGDEFMVFLRDIPNDTVAAHKAQQICSLSRRAFSREVSISASIGIAITPQDGTDFDTLYKKADSALYNVKGSGKNNYTFYHDNMENQHLALEAKSPSCGANGAAEKKHRMLIVDDNSIDHDLLAHIFQDEFIVDSATDGESALIRLRHYGSAISVVLLDLFMPGMNGFAVLKEIRASEELQDIPIVIVSGDDSRETCLQTIRSGATDFVTKPVDPDLLRIRVQSAVSKAENERLRAQNSLLALKNEDKVKYETALDGVGIAFIEYDWISGRFMYYPSMSGYLAGSYDNRTLWEVLLTDKVADEATVRQIRKLVDNLAHDSERYYDCATVQLKTPTHHLHRFRLHMRKLMNNFQLTNKLMITLVDFEHDK